jgi:hypothetical protein
MEIELRRLSYYMAGNASALARPLEGPGALSSGDRSAYNIMIELGGKYDVARRVN